VLPSIIRQSRNDQASTRRDAGRNGCAERPPAPGRVMTRTPTNPMISADQRWTPTFSFKITIDSKAVKSGAANQSPSPSRATAH
jgi:hypothetical protein